MAVDQQQSELRTVPFEPAREQAAGEIDHWAPHGGRPPLARLLTEAGLATDEQIRAAVEEGSRTGERFGEVLLRRGAVTEEDLAHLLASQWGFPFLGNPGPASQDLPPDRAREIPAAALVSDGEQLLVALADPTDERLEQVRGLLGHDVSFVVVTQAALDRLLDEASGKAEADGDALAGGEPASALADARKSLSTIGEALELLETAVAFAEQQAAELAGTRASLSDTERRLASVTAELETARARGVELETGLQRIGELEAQLAQRDELLAGVRTKLQELQGTLEPR